MVVFSTHFTTTVEAKKRGLTQRCFHVIKFLLERFLPDHAAPSSAAVKDKRHLDFVLLVADGRAHYILAGFSEILLVATHGCTGFEGTGNQNANVGVGYNLTCHNLFGIATAGGSAHHQ